MYDIDICGVLIHAKPGHLDSVQSQLAQLPGTEIHAVDNNGRFVITIEGEIPTEDNPKPINSTAEVLKQIQNVEGVLNASMIYQHCE